MSMTRKMQALMNLSAIPLFGPARIRKALNLLVLQETPLEYLLEYRSTDLIELGMNHEQTQHFLESESVGAAEKLAEDGISLVVQTDDDAPERLTDSRINPWFFYYGDLSILHAESIGFSGSRDASPDAIRVTEEMASAATACDLVIISGGARGVDLAAHQSALNAGGSTVVVLAQGFGTWRMPEELDVPNALILSEFVPFDDWGSYRAMQRNKSIVHLSDRLIIPQSGERGGTWNAAEYALKQEHPTWVVDFGPAYPGNEAVAAIGATKIKWSGDADLLDLLKTLHQEEEPYQPSLF